VAVRSDAGHHAAGAGVLILEGALLHNYDLRCGNTFLGQQAGNFTMVA